MPDFDVCRWCKWFAGGYCINEKAFELNIDLSNFYEDGTLAGAIQESFKNIKFEQLENLIEQSKIPKKLQVEIIKTLYADFEDIKAELIEDIDSSVSSALAKFDFGPPGVFIKRPGEFSCKYYW